MLDGEKLFILAAGNGLGSNNVSAKGLDDNLVMTSHKGGLIKIWNV